MDQSKTTAAIAASVIAVALGGGMWIAVKHQFAPADPAVDMAVPAPATFQFKPAELAERFNKIAEAGGLEYRITSQDFKPGERGFDNWTYQFTNRVGFTAFVNKASGRIAWFTYMGSGDGTIRSGADIMFVLGTLMRSIDPALEKEAAGRLAMDLLGSMQSKSEVRRAMNGVEYEAFAMKDVGFFANIRPAN